MNEHEHQPIDSAVHHALLWSFVERGHPLGADELAAHLDVPATDIEVSLRRLDANHGVVLHPGTVEPWLVHPFSTTPTLFYVERDGQGWWAPCIWCALGVAVLVAAPCRITTLLGGETERVVLEWRGDGVEPSDLVAHFPIPVARAWDNVHRHCACTLVFRDVNDVDAWCGRHGVDRGEVLTLAQVDALAWAWYGGHLSPDWRKPTAAEAQRVFESVGLTAPHWRVPGGDERF